MAAEPVYGSPARGAPWYIVLTIVGAPGILAVAFTLATTVIVRRINRADGRPPLSAMQSVLWTLGAGAMWGPVWQFGLQRLVNWLTGSPIFWELTMIAPFVTGIAAMIAYELIRWWSRDRHPGLYALISVKHSSKLGHTGDTPNGDLTTYAEDKTDPGGKP